jgi:hypothetical protein
MFDCQANDILPVIDVAKGAKYIRHASDGGYVLAEEWMQGNFI